MSVSKPVVDLVANWWCYFITLCLQVRSLTLDVKVWEPSVINLFQSLGNTFANSIWEELLHFTNNLESDGIASTR